MNMKTTMTMLKAGLLGLFLAGSVAATAQVVAPVPSTPIEAPEDLDIGTLNDDETTVTPTIPPAVFFYRPEGTNLTLRASLTDDSTDPITFTSYEWYEINTTDGVSEITDIQMTTTRDLVLTNLQPGYHKYRVYGLVNDAGIICQSDEFQDIIFFVLRPLDPTATVETDAITEFCLNAPPAEALDLTATVDFGTPTYESSYANPAVNDFALSYRWYAVNNNDPGTQIELPTATPTATGATHTLSISEYTNLLQVGTYTFYVEVQYSDAIKDREDRAHALWTTQVTTSAGMPYELVVTPAPGRPTITIVEVTD